MSAGITGAAALFANYPGGRLADSGLAGRELFWTWQDAQHALPVGTDRIMEQSPAALETNDVEQRHWTYERALLEVASGLDMIGPGRYRALRQVIGEPINAPREALQNGKRPQAKPRWDRAEGKLWLGEDVIRIVRIRRSPTHVQRLMEAFEEAHWEMPIKNPFIAELGQDTLHLLLNRVNKGLERIRFHGRAGGRDLTWSFLPKV